MLSGVLERVPPREKPEPPAAEAEADPEAIAADPGPKGRGGAPAPRASRAPAGRAARRVRGRTVYVPDDLWERLIVQSHRRDATISDYVTQLLDRHVPDHRVVRAGAPAAPASGAVDDQDAA